SWFESHHPLVLHGVGSPSIRRRFAWMGRARGLRFAQAISPDAKYSSRVAFGDGCIVASGSILTSHIRIGNHCMINMSCTLGHDTQMDDFSTLSPGVHLSGYCHLEEGVDMGAGS